MTILHALEGTFNILQALPLTFRHSVTRTVCIYFSAITIINHRMLQKTRHPTIEEVIHLASCPYCLPKHEALLPASYPSFSWPRVPMLNEQACIYVLVLIRSFPKMNQQSLLRLLHRAEARQQAHYEIFTLWWALKTLPLRSIVLMMLKLNR